MKTANLLSLITLLLLTLNSYAQEESVTGKNGQVVLPQKGNIGLGVNLIPFFYWLVIISTTTLGTEISDFLLEVYI